MLRVPAPPIENLIKVNNYRTNVSAKVTKKRCTILLQTYKMKGKKVVMQAWHNPRKPLHNYCLTYMNVACLKLTPKENQ